jgi:PAS domain S-box-containing protein
MKPSPRAALVLKAAAVLALFAATIGAQLTVSGALDNPLLLSLHLVPIILAAAFWGPWGGLAAGLLSTASVGVPVAAAKPATLPEILGLGVFVFVGIGILVGAMARLVGAVRRRSAQLEAVMMAAQDAVITIDQEGKIASWNLAAGRIFGYTVDEVTGKDLHDLVAHPKFVPLFRNAFPRFLQDGSGAAIGNTVELEGVRSTGEVFPMELSLSAFQTGGKWHAVGIIRDISLRKAAELALRQSESRARTLFEDVPVGLYRTAPTGEIIDANPALAGLLGYDSPRDILAMKAGDLYVDPAERLGFRELAERSDVVRDHEVRLRRRDGAEIVALLTARTVRDEAGRPIRYEGSMQDITQRRIAEAQQKRAERLESVGQLAAGVAHDFNNILAGIQGFAEYLAGREADDRVRDAGRRIVSSSQRAARIVEALLTTLGSHLGTPRRASVAELVQSACDTWSSSAGGEARIDLELDPVPAWVIADPRGIELAIEELLTNAREASMEGGRIVVRTGTGALDLATLYAPRGDLGGTWAWIAVSDAGRGMDQATLEKAFEPYFTTKGFGAGAGLGLTKVYGIVQQNHGVIGVASHPDQGTTVTVYLPAVGAP